MWMAFATLGAGIAVGYLGQRSRLCFVGGLRDWLLIRDTDLVKGAVAFFLAAWIAFPVASLLGGVVWPADSDRPQQELVAVAPVADLAKAQAETRTGATTDPPAASAPFRPWLLAAVAIGAGVGLGFASVLANGCPLRQHVLSAQGSRDAWFYLTGFYGAALVYLVGWVPWL